MKSTAAKKCGSSAVLPRRSASGFLLARLEGRTEKTGVVVRKPGLAAKTRVMYVIRLRGSKEVPPYRVCTCDGAPWGWQGYWLR